MMHLADNGSKLNLMLLTKADFYPILIQGHMLKIQLTIEAIHGPVPVYICSLSANTLLKTRHCAGRCFTLHSSSKLSVSYVLCVSAEPSLFLGCPSNE